MNENLRTHRLPMFTHLTDQAWGGPFGAEVFAKLVPIVATRSETIIELSMAGVERLDSSCSREVLANLVQRYHGSKWFFLSSIANASVRDNIDAAFLRKELSILARGSNGDPEVLGCKLKSHLSEVLKVIEKRSEATSKVVCSAIPDLSLTACNNRLRDLSNAGLVARLEGSASSGGREFAYMSLR